MIIGIDPGNECSAWATMTAAGELVNHAKEANNGIIGMIRHSVLAPMSTIVAIEMIASYGMPVGKEVFETCVWIGRFAEAWEQSGGKVRFIYRRDVKLHHCHNARANDANIRAALIDRYGPGKDKAIGTKKSPGPLYGIKADVWSALAVALTAAES